MAMTAISPADTLSHILGAFPSDYSWYRSQKLAARDASGKDVSDILRWDGAVEWSAEFVVDDPDGDGAKAFTVGHAEVMKAVRRISSKDRPEYVSSTCAHQCRNLLFEPDEVDFDAGTADEVLQVAMFGKVVFG